MALFFGDWSTPNQVTVDPRTTIRIKWIYYRESTDPQLQYYKFSWKDASERRWDVPSVKTITLSKENQFYDVPPNTFALGSTMVWRIGAWTMNVDATPELDPSDPGYVAPVITETQDNVCIVDCSGWTIMAENPVAFTSTSMGRSSIPMPATPPPPGLYEVRVRARNGFQWSDWGAPTNMTLYDTRKWVKRPASLNAAVVRRKESGTWKEIIP